MSSPFDPPAQEEVPAPPELEPAAESLMGYTQATASPKLVAGLGLGLMGAVDIAGTFIALAQGTLGLVQLFTTIAFTAVLLAAALVAWVGIQGFLAGPARTGWILESLWKERWGWFLLAGANVAGVILVGGALLQTFVL